MKKKNKTSLTIEQSQTLVKLARQIRDTYENTEALIVKAQTADCSAIAEAIQCGKALNDAKQLVGHGKWLKWLSNNCKKVSFRTAQKYMALANANHSSYLKDVKSLRQAYILVGIIPEITPGEVEPDPTTQEQVSPTPAVTDIEKAVEAAEISPEQKALSKKAGGETIVPALVMFEKAVLDMAERFELLDLKQKAKAKKILKEKLSKIL